MSEPTLEEMKTYWRYQNTLTNCSGCTCEHICWQQEGVAYRPEAMLKHCPFPEIRKAIQGISEMQRDKPPGFYAITGKWFHNKPFLETLFEET